MAMTLDLKRMTNKGESLVVCKTHPTIDGLVIFSKSAIKIIKYNRFTRYQASRL